MCIGADGDPAAALRAPTERTEIRLYTAACCATSPRSRCSRCRWARCTWPTTTTSRVALRMDGYLREGRAPASRSASIAPAAMQAPIYLDADFLLGPEAAHLNITGVSGLATKTSAVEWLLSSIFAHFPAQKGQRGGGLLQREGAGPLLPRPARRELDDADRALYERLGVPAEPFQNVRVLRAVDGATATRWQHAALQRRARAQRAAAHVGAARGAAVRRGAAQQGRRGRQGRRADRLHPRARRRPGVHRSDAARARTRVRSFADLERGSATCCAAMERATPRPGARTTWRPSARCATGCRTSPRAAAGWSPTTARPATCRSGAFEDRAVYVIDVADVEEDAQDLIFARVVSQAARASGAARPRREPRRRLRGRAEQVRAGRRTGHLRRQDAARHRRARAATWGSCCSRAQQFRSQVHRRVVGQLRARRCTGAWTWTNWRRRATPCSRRRRASSSRRSTRDS